MTTTTGSPEKVSKAKTVWGWIAAVVAILFLSGLVAAVVLSPVTPNSAKAVTPESASANMGSKGIGKVVKPAVVVSAPTVKFYALDPSNPNVLAAPPLKEVYGAVGTPVLPLNVVPTMADVPNILKELSERREAGTDNQFDPELIATHYADWSQAKHKNGKNANLTEHPITYDQIDAFKAQISTDSALRDSVVNELVTLETKFNVSIKPTSKGTWSVYVEADGHGGLITKVGKTSHDGYAIAFTSGDITIQYRLNCGFQILHPFAPPGLPQCTIAECPPTCEQLGNCPVTCPPGNVNPDCAPKSHNAADYVHPSGKPQAPAPTTAPTATSAPVVTTQTGGGGVVDTPTNAPGTETGGTAPGADPPTPTQTNPPVNQGGDNGAGDPGGF